jgi:BolA family transcriptional regulator, general stress-responsive regulator
MTMESRIRERLEATFAPLFLDVINESHLHHGHAGSPNSGQSHFRVHIVVAGFAGASRLERHRLVNEALKVELADGIHALAIKAEAPAQGN